jgi:hypothetical protein
MFISGNSLSSDEMDTGEATISMNDQNYTINFSFANAGNTVTGNFTGPLTILNIESSRVASASPKAEK